MIDLDSTEHGLPEADVISVQSSSRCCVRCGRRGNQAGKVVGWRTGQHSVRAGVILRLAVSDPMTLPKLNFAKDDCASSLEQALSWPNLRMPDHAFGFHLCSVHPSLDVGTY